MTRSHPRSAHHREPGPDERDDIHHQDQQGAPDKTFFSAAHSMRRTAPASRPYGRYAVGLRPSLDPDAYFGAPRQLSEKTAPATKNPLTDPAPSGMTCGYPGGRYWDRTSDLFRVREARYRCANRPCRAAVRVVRDRPRRRRESNPCTGLCRPLPKPLGHSARTRLADPAGAVEGHRSSGRRDSNPRPSPWQGDALPAEPRPHHAGRNDPLTR